MQPFQKWRRVTYQAHPTLSGVAPHLSRTKYQYSASMPPFPRTKQCQSNVYSKIWFTKRRRGNWVAFSKHYCNIDRHQQAPDNCTGVHTRTFKRLVLSPGTIYSRTTRTKVWLRQEWIFGLNWKTTEIRSCFSTAMYFILFAFSSFGRSSV